MTSRPAAISNTRHNSSGAVVAPNTVINASTTTNHPIMRQSRRNCFSSAEPLIVAKFGAPLSEIDSEAPPKSPASRRPELAATRRPWVPKLRSPIEDFGQLGNVQSTAQSPPAAASGAVLGLG